MGARPKLPPYGHFLGISVEDCENGPLFRMPFGISVTGRPHFLHGGALAGLLEIAAVGTLMAALQGEAGVSVKPVNVTVDFMRGGRERDTFAAATVLRLGTRIANVEALAWQEDRDKLIASARMTLMVRRPTRNEEG
ncbi:PaaI family thioesterase [Sphingomonas sp. CGMCC 1.13654]|uniref:PaaI family thioesterase n=1 Tax=Sphingomonas chungangi TaxID=2683589 RepID=A0A838L7P1_9SPHN|nr:PaaI family thioesterase [Sphingomonas chungangi]MBA2934930.1 PaaI family thioesterase [Sphingomonas chungangi]MVW58241.1 hotdog fold thioesterase [Sphingomonas chungangi]